MIKLSILVPTVPSRLSYFYPRIMKQLLDQCASFPEVEILGFFDNKKRTVGEKRQDLLNMSRGEYLTFIDDDDRIADDYVSAIIDALNHNPETDCVVFDCICRIEDGAEKYCKYGIEFEYGDISDTEWRGKPAHIMVYKSSIAKNHVYSSTNFGEDCEWVIRACVDIKHQTRIDKVLYYYDCKPRTTSETRCIPDNVIQENALNTSVVVDNNSFDCNTIIFEYNGINYEVLQNANDASTYGSINEIVFRDEYVLKEFKSDEANVFIDIGANCGIATIILAKQNPNSIVYSFEPDIRVFNILCKNVVLNNLSNVKLYNYAVADNGIKSIKLGLHPQYSGGNTTCADLNSLTNYFNCGIDCIDVKCVSFDEIISQNNIKKVKLLKIDCEGAEYEIIYGSKYIKSNIIENIVGEYHSLPYNIKTSNKTTTELINYTKQYVKGIFKITILIL